MNNLYEVLEVCLQDIEQGADIETVLFRYPELADELRPILEGSVNARSMAIVAPSAEVVLRNRAKVLQRAAQLREAQARPSSRRVWFTSLRRVTVTLVVVAALLVSGTGLVSAASATLPGDNLYPVKRTWEDVLLLFTFNLQQREALEIEHENERLYELWELFADGRSVEVEFSGLVTSQNGDEWLIHGVPVIISAQTEVRDGPVTVGSAVRVKGRTHGDGIVLAERVRLLPPDAKLPDEFEVEEEDHEDNSGKGSEGEETETRESESGSNDNSSNSRSGSDNSGSGSGHSGSDDNGNEDDDSREDNSGSDHDDKDNDDSKDNSGHGSGDSGGDDDGHDSDGGDDNSGSGGGDDDGGDDGGGDDEDDD